MNQRKTLEAFVLGLFLCGGLIGLGYLISNGILEMKKLERTVTVKGLSEQEAPADIAIWPISFSEADNDLTTLYGTIQRKTEIITTFLKSNGFQDSDISISVPNINDREAQSYGDTSRIKYRYTATANISVYSTKVDAVRNAMKKIVELIEKGIALAGQDYMARPQFLFTKLNDLKPAMIEEATRNAREVAEKFAKDSNSRLGKIRKAAQGQFSIDDRDSDTPHIKKIRVVSTLEYYLSD
ncbi:MAG: SIMPL domain-containing protein [Desulfuromonadaceae bacterium]|nr:SIMPL domain-containing protein [Desulfuromonadaceae bacterium]